MNSTFISNWKPAALLSICAGLITVTVPVFGQEAAKPAKVKPAAVTLPWPPTLPDGKLVATDTAPEFLQKPATISADVTVAKTAPTIDFAYFPGQDYEGKPWSNWGDSLAANGKYYASLGDHLSVLSAKGDPNRAGNAVVYEYDPAQKSFRLLAETRKILNLPEGHYAPGKIHGRLDLDDDGWLYFSTHRGSTNVTRDAYHYQGDWIIRVHPTDGRTEVLACGPVPKHCIPNSVLDPKRKIFYGGTAPGVPSEGDGVKFFAFDVNEKKVLYAGPNGPARYMILAKSTGRVYFVPSKEDGAGQLMRFDPATGAAPTPLDVQIGLRSATQETPAGMVYTVSKGTEPGTADIYAFNTKTETGEKLGPAQVGGQNYITTLDTDTAGRYVYYIPGAHGGSERDGSAVVQFDTKTKTRKIIAFLHPFYKDKYGASLVGTFSSAVDPDGSKLYITWNVNRGGKSWDCCALTVIHIPASERPL